MPTTKYKTYPHHNFTMLMVGQHGGGLMQLQILAIEVATKRSVGDPRKKSKQKRADYVIKFYAALAKGKDFSIWMRRTSTCGARAGAVPYRLVLPGKNIHVIAVISSSGLAYQESQFSSFTADLANEFIRRFLRHISTTMSLDEVVVVLDYTPCHTDAEDVFDEEEFKDAEVLKLGPYSPMLNPIENVFSVYKSAVKRFLARQRPAILRVPDGTTITEHRAKYLNPPKLKPTEKPMVRPLGKVLRDSEVTGRDLSFKSMWKQLNGQ
ncbi:LOW QUALITY PROTEIN: Hypothetical protein PHPALM_12480 [Phytophthora palmivora]|uniref:Tc1-like transposase DDE domain-containing protein n=1 Tax=Phytophthora palmivora TaxID=4796 RepID=A0A2P4XZM0_9STRA|nr:LOW QUALITY PROTEIN: Hypothetical protein PHPALM_12480 [Phytophthora palmivora]